MTLRTIAIVPAHNEAERIPSTLEALWNLEEIERVILVDDGSRDSTSTLAAAMDAEVLAAAGPGTPRGKGHALVAGLSRARRYSPEAFLIADADLGESAMHLSSLIIELDDSSPVTIAAFPPAKGGGFGLIKNYARREIYRRTGYSPSEPLSGQRAILFEALETLPGIAPGFGAEVGMTLDLLAADIKPLEIPLHLEHRPTNRTVTGFTHRARQGFDILRALRGNRIPW
ncbi:MAG: glycosyltransferase [Rubrobacteraceae bacterium]